MQVRFKLTLFVTPESSGKALAHLYKALENLAYNDYELVIVDVLMDPVQAKEANVVTTPALVLHRPGNDFLLRDVQDYDEIRKALRTG